MTKVTQNDAIAQAYIKANAEGSFEIPCGSEKEAGLLRFRIYGFLKRFKKSQGLVTGLERQQLLQAAVPNIALIVEGDNLVFKHRGDMGAMPALFAAVEAETERAIAAESGKVESIGQRLLEQLGVPGPAGNKYLDLLKE